MHTPSTADCTTTSKRGSTRDAMGLVGSMGLRLFVSNAVDAYDAPGNVVEVRVFSLEGNLVLEVEDRGSGIPEEIRDRIFDHFFTTKDVGKGSGLGLALVHDLVTEYFGGSIELRTAVGSGTCFTVRLPLSRGILP